MIIREASLVYRFYTDDGWTREDVANLLHSKDITKVIPRYQNLLDDEMIELDNGLVLNNNHSYSDAWYFAVYNSYEEFDLKLLAEHDIISFHDKSY